MAGTAALLLAVNPLHIWYSQEARPYALLVCLGTAALLCLARALERDQRGWWIAFAVLSAVTILCHVTGVVYLLVGGIWTLYARGLRGLSRFAVAAVGTFLLTLPFLLTLMAAVRHATGTGSPERPLTGLEVPYSLFTDLAGYSFGPPVREIQDLGWSGAVANHPLQTVFAGMVLLVLCVLVGRARSRRMVVFATWLLAPLALTIVGSLLTTKSFNVRYVLPGLVGFLGLIAIALDGLRPALRAIGLGLVVGLSLYADAQWFTSSVYWKDDSRTVAHCLTRYLPAGSVVGVASPALQNVLTHYAPNGGGVRFVGVADSGSLVGINPAALAVSRVYYLPGLEQRLVRAFWGPNPNGVSKGAAPGYGCISPPSLPTQPGVWPTGPPDGASLVSVRPAAGVQPRPTRRLQQRDEAKRWKEKGEVVMGIKPADHGEPWFRRRQGRGAAAEPEASRAKSTELMNARRLDG